MIMSYNGSAFLLVLGLRFCAAGSGQCLNTEVIVIYSIPGMLESYLSDGRDKGLWCVCVCVCSNPFKHTASSLCKKTSH